MKLLNLCKGKIHRATVTCTDINYEGSIMIDEDLLDAAGIVDGEYVHVWNINNGERFETYAIPGPRGTGEICVNGAAARLAEPGDKVIVVAFILTDEPIKRQVVLVDEENRITKRI